MLFRIFRFKRHGCGTYARFFYGLILASLSMPPVNVLVSRLKLISGISKDFLTSIFLFFWLAVLHSRLSTESPYPPMIDCILSVIRMSLCFEHCFRADLFYRLLNNERFLHSFWLGLRLDFLLFQVSWARAGNSFGFKKH